ncbi:hypothetical protein AB0J80_12245 [Actinoplanes sp. NPDC049548]|uniref:hypothetical protein n=1 Tax=Actinoplanes sp. NPDC049548 TaxID=3155152 RepID=UPI0034356473
MNDEVPVVVTAINPWGVEVATLGDGERGFIDNLKLPADSTPAVGDELTVVVLDDERTPFRASLLDVDFAIARKPRTAYDYRLLKAPWGIRITFVAEVEPFSDRRTAIPVGHGVRVAHDLDEEQSAAVAAGLALVAKEISAATAGSPVDIVVHSVHYAETDFQIEGLTAAAVGWATERFALPPRRPAVHFDRTTNRYVFDWSPKLHRLYGARASNVDATAVEPGFADFRTLIYADGGVDLDDVELGVGIEALSADGSLRDVCVLGAGLEGWQRLFRAVPAAPWPYELERNGERLAAEEFHVEAHFAEVAAGSDISVRLSVQVGSVGFDSFLFEPEEIEFCCTPANPEDTTRFMAWLAEVCSRRVILTYESSTGHADAVPIREVLP